LLSLIHTLNDVIIKVVDLIMLIAPLGVFALISKTIVSVAGNNTSQILELLGALALYCFVVIAGLIIMSFLVYPSIIRFFTPMSVKTFFKGIAPAQLLAFSTSSSSATLPLTMERCEQNLGVSEEVSAFVLPLGATINMDGTALYQAVAALFIAQATGMQLDLMAQLTIIITTVLASIGTAGVPGAGIIMLVVILESVGVPSAGIALILGVDRLLDMMRTSVNITGDAAVSVWVAHTENQLGSANFDFEGVSQIHLTNLHQGPGESRNGNDQK
jgi:proton glutamate symport protein